MGAPVSRLLLNGKFLAAAPTGVHRVAQELGNALAALIAEGHPAVAGLSIEALCPHDALARARADMRMPVRRLGPGRHIAWEQFTLPTRRGEGVLLNLCNIGPVVDGNSVTMIHDAQVLIAPGSYSWAFRLWYRLIQPRLARRARLVLTVSEYSRRELVAAGLAPSARIAVVPNGVDHVLACPADRSVLSALGLSRHGYVLALANTQEHKNVRLLLRAFAGAGLGGLRLVLFGGAGAQDFAARGEEVPPATVFAGRTTDGQLRALMEDALCLAFPSTTEGFGLPPLEAMRLGCPAVVAPCGALPEVCGPAAVYAPADDPLAWRSAFAAMVRDPAGRARRIDEGLVWAAQFTWRRSALALAAALKAL